MRRSSSDTRPCPNCGEPLQRVRRRFVDRVISLVMARRRYRCDNPSCGWEGNLPRFRR